MQRVRRNILGLLGMLAIFTVAGCGFVNVAELSPTVKKISVLVIGPSPLFRDPQIAGVIASPPPGLSIATAASDGNQSSDLYLLNHSLADEVIMVQPSQAMMATAAAHPDIRYYWISDAASSNLANVTVVSPDLERLASVAGYIAGGALAAGEPLYVLANPAPATATSTSVVDAVYSGAHAAFANSPVVKVGSVSQAAAPVSGAWVVIGTVSSIDGGTLASTNQKVVSILSGNRFGTGQTIASYSESDWIKNSLQRAFAAIAGNNAPTSLSAEPLSFHMNNAIGPPSLKAINVYEQLILSGALSPQGFLDGSPDAKTAKALQLPVPPNLAR